MASTNTGISTQCNKEEHMHLGPRITLWCERHMRGYVFMLIIALIVGVATGTMAHIFKVLIHKLAYVFIPEATQDVNWWLIAVPVVGILLTGIFTRYIIHTNLIHVCAQLIQRIKVKAYRIPGNETFSPVLGGALTLGMGGSSGAEGPIAATGAAIGSNVGRFLGLNKNRMKILVAAGASAGIAGIFSAPIGGVLFSLELMEVALATVPVLIVITAALAAYLTILSFEGFNPDFHIGLTGQFEWATLPAVACLGICCGIYCLYYSSVTNYMDTVFKRFKNPWVQNITGGLMLGFILLLFPSMFSTGYPVLNDVVNGDFGRLTQGSVFNLLGFGEWTLVACAIGILVVKCWAVSATNSSGGVGGDFAPTLFAGGIAGFLFATLTNHFAGSSLPVGMFAFYGMAGVMSGAIRTPLMAIFIVLEMTAGYRYAVPVSIVALLSYLTVRFGALTENAARPLVKHLNWLH